jgi:predicted nucleic acid-binding protein
MPCLADTNVLLRWANAEHPDYALLSRVIEALFLSGDDVYVTPQNLIEYWCVSTRPLDRNGLGLSVMRTNSDLQRIKSYFRFAPDSPAIFEEWERLVSTHGVYGAQVHDAGLAAAMLTHGIPRIITFNTRDFVRYPGIQAMHPVALSEALESA